MTTRTIRRIAVGIALALAMPVAPAVAAEPAPSAVPGAVAAAGVDAAAVGTYVTAVYRNLLGRNPDAAGHAAWTRAISTGSPLRSVASSITSSNEYRGKLIQATYREFLGRNADAQGMQTWLAALQRGATIQDIETGFIASSEFYARSGGTPAGWVAALYRTVLGRTAGAAEVAHWTDQLAKGSSRRQVARGFVLSGERLANVIDRHYVALLGRTIDPSGRSTWVSRIQNGSRLEEVVGSILSSTEYVRRVTGTTLTDPPVTTPTPPTNDPLPPTPDPERPGGRPGPANTGVPAGTQLTIHAGDLVITQPGTVIDGRDIRGFVTVRAANVTIKNSIVRGGSTAGFTSSRALVSVSDPAYSVTIVDSELAPTTASPYVDGLRGMNITARRVNIHNVIDSAHLWGSNVVIENSWLHDNVHFTSDPNQGGTPSHDDSIQIQAGSNIRIRNNTITGATNTGIQFTQDRGVVSDVRITGNFLDGGGCTINFAEKDRGPFQGVVITDNTFGRTTKHPDCAIIAKTGTRDLLTTANNYFEDGKKAEVRRGD